MIARIRSFFQKIVNPGFYVVRYRFEHAEVSGYGKVYIVADSREEAERRGIEIIQEGNAEFLPSGFDATIHYYARRPFPWETWEGGEG